MASDRKAVRTWRGNRKSFEFFKVRQDGGGPRERQRTLRKIEMGLIKPGFQGFTPKEA